ncbi:endoplasmic oxidoreductin-1 [Trichomonascus vanleenenianus]|uniref:ER oxidoreductin n=1 Tax=Trichomonascus vanleenenianus TaxID=2268995 RepID=UPI003EC9D12B
MKLQLLVALAGSLAIASADIRVQDSGFCSTQNGIVDDASFKAVEENNHIVRPILKDLVKTDYFRYYKVDLSGDQCPFVDDQGMCGNRACAVDPVEDESEIPEFWRSNYLGKLAKDSYSDEVDGWESGLSGSCVNNDASVNLQAIDSCSVDYCYPEDESLNSKGVYVSLTDNPERYTGYIGAHANKIWRAAYLENCFGYHGDGDKPASGVVDDSFSVIDKSRFGGLSPAAQRLGNVIEGFNTYEKREVGGELAAVAMSDEICAEQKLFYQLISGMHSSVSTHLCYENLNKTTGKWGPNLQCFMARVGNYPERLKNLYFNYGLVQRAIAKLNNYIDDLYFCRDDPTSDKTTRKRLLELTRAASSSGKELFDETQVFATPEMQSLKNEFRRRVRNVNALMACVGCDRCRLWGKLQTAGYGTALKVLLELPERPQDNVTSSNQILSTFKRSELVSLINVYDRLSKSVEAVEYFRSEFTGEKDKRDDEHSAWDDWDPEFRNVWEALKFIFRSYVEFPKNLWNLLIVYLDHYWNRFVGREVGDTFYRDL